MLKLLKLLFCVFILLCTNFSIFPQERKPVVTKQLNDHIWVLDDNGETSSFIIVGKQKAAVIDTLLGYEDILALVRKITNLPLVVINTHGHCDHIMGNGYFKQEIFINQKDIPLTKIHYSYPQSKYVIKKNKFGKINFVPTKHGDTFELGGITLEVIEFQGHTKGGILLLDKQDRILFTGDSINRHNWMQLPEGLSIPELQKSLEKIQHYRSQFDYILHNHDTKFEPASLYDEYCGAIKELLAGKTKKDTVFLYFGGACKQHKYSKGEVVIVYNEKKLK